MVDPASDDATLAGDALPPRGGAPAVPQAEDRLPSVQDTVAPGSDPSFEETGLAALAETGAPLPSSRGRAGAGALGRGASFGRYLVLDLLGAGGMGVVYAAYDPELDRKIALKLLIASREGDSRASEGRTRLLREAQAMAKLGHPNVIAVHDVGERDGQVFVAMEFVDGQTLRSWSTERRSWRDSVAVLVRAGRGLAAAHAVGLIHRDFKPDNVMVDRVASEGGHGRVRVMDFGLARPTAAFEATTLVPTGSTSTGVLTMEVTQQGAMVGTPAYMAPEQIRGESCDARVDQFAFCITLWEALYGQRPFRAESLPALVDTILAGRITAPPKGSGVPIWVRRIITRGLATDAQQRWPSMQELLAALDRDPARTRRRWAAVGLVGALGAGAYGWQQLERAQAIAACDDEGAAISELWDEPQRTATRDALLATGVANAEETWERLVPWLDDYADRWQALRTDACTATEIEQRRSPELLGESRACLDERRLAFGELLAVLATADAQTVLSAITSASALPQLEACTDDRWLVQRVRLPEDAETRDRVLVLRRQIARASALLDVGRAKEAGPLIDTALADARALAWGPIVAEAELMVGTVREVAGDFAGAETALRAAFLEAGAVAADELAVEAADALVGVVGDQLARHDDGLEWVALARMGLRRMGAMDDTLRAADLHESAGWLHVARGDYESALAEQEAALVITEPMLGGDHPRVAEAVGGIAFVHFKRGDFDRAIEWGERAVAITERALGPTHPALAKTLDELAAAHHLARNLDTSVELHHRALTIRESVNGADHPAVALSLNNLGNAEQAREHYDAALGYYERALAIWQAALGPSHPDIAASLYNIARLHSKRGSYEAALDHFRRSLAIAEATLGADHPHIAYPLTGIGLTLLDLQRAGEAVAPLDRAIALRDKPGVDPAELAEARFALAQALVDSGGDRRRAHELASAAEEAYAAAGESAADDLASVRTWLRSHAAPPR